MHSCRQECIPVDRKALLSTGMDWNAFLSTGMHSSRSFLSVSLRFALSPTCACRSGIKKLSRKGRRRYCQTASERATVTLISKHKHTQVYVRARRTAPSPSKSRPRTFSMALFADSTIELTCLCRAGRQQITSHTQSTILSQLCSEPCLRLHTQVQGCASICICICIRIYVHMCMCMRILYLH